MEAVVREIDQWPPPVPGQTVHLPLIGVLFQVKDMLKLYNRFINIAGPEKPSEWKKS